ncbi:hypothetical protein AB205_0101080 [Aquarana catesbeiana]|uniref:Uncharacterized protein n=1 Tax=Aquarana catesbeiana TaxID=8400 RepID=A0A2G9QDQ3_AQUCT|nr:hypothetical protein AB205_0101080 [Aquarana catesbeiana]
MSQTILLTPMNSVQIWFINVAFTRTAMEPPAPGVTTSCDQIFLWPWSWHQSFSPLLEPGKLLKLYRKSLWDL